jgi:hypothetical protein
MTKSKGLSTPLPPLVAYFRDFCQGLPHVNVCGELVCLPPAGSRGHDSKKEMLKKDNILSELSISSFILDKFPAYLLLEIIPNPTEQVLAVLKNSGGTKLKKTA